MGGLDLESAMDSWEEYCREHGHEPWTPKKTTEVA